MMILRRHFKSHCKKKNLLGVENLNTAEVSVLVLKNSSAEERTIYEQKCLMGFYKCAFELILEIYFLCSALSCLVFVKM